MEKLKIKPFNPVEGMTDEEIIEYLADCLLDGEETSLAPLNSYASNAT